MASPVRLERRYDTHQGTGSAAVRLPHRTAPRGDRATSTHDGMGKAMVTRTLAFALSILAACWLVGAAPSGAALSTTDSRFGTDTLVEDSATGLDWLILPITQGFSVDQILTTTEPGGSFEEFRLATRDELVTLLDSLSIPFNGTC